MTDTTLGLEENAADSPYPTEDNYDSEKVLEAFPDLVKMDFDFDGSGTPAAQRNGFEPDWFVKMVDSDGEVTTLRLGKHPPTDTEGLIKLLKRLQDQPVDMELKGRVDEQLARFDEVASKPGVGAGSEER